MNVAASLAGIGVIYNPRSGHHRRNPRAGLGLARTLGPHGVVREVCSIDALYRAAEDFRKLDIDLLGISGGDGTNSITISGFLDVYAGSALPQIALLRGGTANTLADAIGIQRGRPAGLVATLLQAYLARASRPLRSVERQLLHVCGHDSHRCDAQRASLPPGAATYGFLFGTGVVSGYLQEYYAAGSPSALIAAKTLLRGIGSALVRGPLIRRMAKPFRGSVELDGGEVWPERDYLAIAAGTIDHIGLGFKPFYRAQECQHTFHVLGICTSPLGFVTQLPNVWRGRAMSPGHAYESLATGIRVRAAERTIKYMVDGDLYQCDGGLELRVGPVVRLVTGM